MGLSNSKEVKGTFGPWSPTSLEVRYTTLILSRIIPPELILLILEQAEYWPVSRYRLERSVMVRSVGPKMGLRILRTDGLQGCASISSIQRIKITTESRDQGFSAQTNHHGTREASYSWFETVLLRRDPTLPPIESESEEEESTPEDEILIHRTEVVRNIHAGREYVSFTKEYNRGDEMVDLARRGDFIEVWGYAHYPAWSNDIHKAEIEVEYMV